MKETLIKEEPIQSTSTSEPTNGVQPVDKTTSPENPVTQYSKRLVEKNGTSNVLPKATSSRRNRFLSDIFTTLSDMRWRYCLIMFVLAYLSTWTAFSVVYWFIAYVHEDTVNIDNADWDPCISNVQNFVSAFLFSVETQHTIGYGSRAMKETCYEAIATYMVQSCASVLINSLFCGLVFAKLMSPRYRSKSIRFSRQAVISFHNDVGYLIFRVIDFKKSNLVDCMIKAVLIRDRVTKEGEFIPFSNRNLRLHVEKTNSKACFLVWPVNVIHTIDEHSPLFGLSPRELQEEYLEIIVVLEGLVENSGKLLQVRTSYVSHEIIWGASFSTMLNFNMATNQYEMDFAKFDEIILTLPLPSISQSKNSQIFRRSGKSDRKSILEEKNAADETNCDSRALDKSSYTDKRFSCVSGEHKMQKIKKYLLRRKTDAF
ncbi:hypothetical protein HELRODRAFT_108208 [Helobdella robusta]|uniref:Inward rectifier potassium channel C-terminal domain-containing protein n=1 Tax=Helobdella robusta TaxID=6412 RepID=T1EEG9_HELRO|nr:hypothetical protein HELRODRAFT_108208 [Helobdella robusta]ESN92971.1 hypothetical protein HELRODRAFT_108208 [Helobdella robusta]